MVLPHDQADEDMQFLKDASAQIDSLDNFFRRRGISLGSRTQVAGRCIWIIEKLEAQLKESVQHGKDAQELLVLVDKRDPCWTGK